MEARFLGRGAENAVLGSSGYSRLPKELAVGRDRGSSTWLPAICPVPLVVSG